MVEYARASGLSKFVASAISPSCAERLHPERERGDDIELSITDQTAPLRLQTMSRQRLTQDRGLIRVRFLKGAAERTIDMGAQAVTVDQDVKKWLRFCGDDQDRRS